jgi:signal transduction histidine kinase
VRASLAWVEDELRIEVQDHGVGFDPHAETDGFGGAGARERVFDAGGTFEIRAAHPGTVVRVSLPTGQPRPSALSAAD